MKFHNKDFTTIYEDVRKAITDEIWESLGATPILICRYSNHPDDHYLYLYIAQKGYDNYIAGLANTSRGNSVGLYENHYNCTFEQAMEITTNKIHDCNKGGN
jgi:hypothetical protein